jgi:hypothetical protein
MKSTPIDLKKIAVPGILLVFVLLTYWPIFTSSSLPGGTLSDTVHQGYPFAGFIESSIRAGHLPNWNPWIFGGVPFYSSFSAPVFYPVRGLLLLTAGSEAMIRFTFPIHMLLGGIFAWLFLGSIGVSRAGRLVGALAFAGGGWANTLFYAGHGSKIICWSYLPLLLYACERWMATRRPVFLGLGGLALGMQGLASHPQMVLYSGLAAIIWVLSRAFSERGKLLGRGVLCLVCIAVLGAGIAFVQLFPGYNFSHYSSRGEDLSLEQAASYSLPPEESLTMILPNMFGLRHGFLDSSLSGLPIYFGRLGLRLSSEFLGVSVFLLGLLGFLMSPGKIRWPLIAITLAGLLISWGGYTPFFRILYGLLPIFRKLRAPHMAAFLTTSGIALMAGPGFDSFVNSLKHRRKLLVISVFTGICVLLFLLAAPLSRSLQSSWWTRVGAPGGSGFMTLVERRASLLGGDLARAAGAGFVLLALLYLGKKYRSIGSGFTAGAVIILLALELVPFNRSFQVYLPQTRIDQLFPDQPGLRELAGEGRVIPGGNDLVPLSIRSVGGYHAAKPAVTDQLQDLLALGDLAVARQTAVSVFEVNGSPMRYEEVRDLIILQMSGSDSAMSDSISRLIPREPMPRVFFASSLMAVDEEQIPGLLALGLNPEEITLLTEVPEGLMEGSSISIGSAVLRADLPETVSIGTVNDEIGLLVLADTWYPRWRVFVDGQEAVLLKANLWQRAVVVPAGSHTVEFHFDSGDVRTGLLVTIIGLLAVIAAAVFDRLHSFRKPE